MKAFTSTQKDDFSTNGENLNKSELDVSAKEIANLQEKVKNLARTHKSHMPDFGRKMCPTRHGCKGATNCDYSYANYPG